MQWIDGALSKREKVEFFHDEFRCPIYVKDLVTIILALTGQWISGIGFLLPKRIYWLDKWHAAKNKIKYIYINDTDFLLDLF